MSYLASSAVLRDHTRLGSTKLALVLLLLIHGAYAAPFDAQGPNLTVTTATAVVRFRGPDVIGFTNRITGETYLRPPSFGAASTLITGSSSDSLTPGSWKIGDTGESATLTAADAARSISVTASVDPSTQELVIRVAGTAPQGGVERLIWAVTGFDVTQGRFILPAAGGMSVTAALLTKQTSHYFGVEDSGRHWEAPLALFQTTRGGVAIYSTDTQALFKGLTIAANLAQTANALFSVAAPAPWRDATAAGPVEWRIAAYAGEWSAGARVYRDWHARTMPELPLDGARAWAANIRTVVKLYVSPYDPAVLDDLATRLDPAQTLLYLADWRTDPFDVNYPNYTAAASAKALAQHAHQLGFHIMLHTNMVGVSPSNSDFAAVGSFQAKDEDGEQLLGWNWGRPASTPNRFAFIDPAAASYRTLFVDRIRGAVQDLGADALHLHLAGWPANDGRGRIDGLNFIQGAAQLHKDLLAAFPGLVLSGEGTNDFISPFQSFSQQVSLPQGIDAGIAPPVPISAYLFPNVRPYGHLAFPNPYEAGFLSFFSQYEAQSVLPTFSIGFTGADRPDYGNRDMARQMKLVQVFQQRHLLPDWDSNWGTASVKYAGDNATAVLTDDGTQVQFELQQPGSSAVLYQRVHGLPKLQSNLHVPDWPAYSGNLTLGLDATDQYWLETQSGDPSLIHITDVPPDVTLSTGTDTLVTPDFAYFKVHPIASNAFDFLNGLWQARTGITYNQSDRELGDGASVQIETIISGGESRWSIAAQPPGAGDTFVEFDVPVGGGYSAVLNFAAGIQDAAIGLRGPMTFRVLVNGTLAWQNNVSPGRWQPGSVDLTPFLNQTVHVRFVTTPGPSNDPSFGWGGWSTLSLSVVNTSFTTSLTLSVPASVTAASITVPDGAVTVRNGVASITGLPFDRTILIFAATPKSIAVGQSLIDFPFNKSQSSDGQLAGPSKIPYAGDVGITSAGGVKKQPTIFGFSPSYGQLILSWPLRLPSSSSLYLSFAAGLSDGATPAPQGVALSVRVNGTVLWRTNANLPSQWQYGTVDLSSWAGGNVLLELISDSLGQNSADWTSWTDLTLHGSQGGTCAAVLNPNEDIVALASGRAGNIQVTAGSDCSWTTTGASWIDVTPAAGSGNGIVNYRIAVNPGPSRLATISIAGHLVKVTQQASPAPQITIGGVVSSANFRAPVAPGSIATVFGSSLSTSESIATGMPLALWLGGLSVTVGGIPAPLYYAGPNLINFQVPYEIPPGFADVIVSVRGVQSAAEPVQVALTAPGLFMYGAGRAIVQNADYSLNTENNPAQVGAYVSVYMTGGGAVDNPPGTGRAAPLFPPSQFGAHVSATIGGVDAPVAFAGLTPGYAGLGQINLRVPTLPTGTYPVVITVGDRQTNSGDITVAR